jgi:hypothetical protein
MNVRKLHHLYTRLHHLRLWYFLVPALIFGLLAIHGLRSNYSTMVELREAVYVADRENGDVEGALVDLREHVHGHMNTNLTSGSNAIKPPIQLKARYERLVTKEQERIKIANAQVTAQAEQTCGAQHPAAGFNAARVACIQEFVRVNGTKAREVPDQLYKFDFISPRWSPDLAGISLVLSFVSFLLLAARVALEYYMRRKLR